MAILDEEDEFRFVVLSQVVKHLHKLDGERREDLANRIASAVGAMLGG